MEEVARFFERRLLVFGFLRFEWRRLLGFFDLNGVGCWDLRFGLILGFEWRRLLGFLEEAASFCYLD
ncbi:hypothetical protein Patl1_07507 [Pistacia atlantica]|uniref:Uncharacterized protein n=1 Tax=Pistacia atlantica TaxID=434234 RepID=A0ACC1ADQ7_9ROSI|nr:hypothetical protein Patl1_07507 [Pistacia atlantica]